MAAKKKSAEKKSAKKKPPKKTADPKPLPPPPPEPPPVDLDALAGLCCFCAAEVRNKDARDSENAAGLLACPTCFALVAKIIEPETPENEPEEQAHLPPLVEVAWRAEQLAHDLTALIVKAGSPDLTEPPKDAGRSARIKHFQDIEFADGDLPQRLRDAAVVLDLTVGEALRDLADKIERRAADAGRRRWRLEETPCSAED